MAKEEDVKTGEKRQHRDKAADKDRTEERDKKRSRQAQDIDSSKVDNGDKLGRSSEAKSPDRSGRLSTRPSTAEKPRVDESNGEVSMSIEETNRVRISLGLKPLSVGNSREDERNSAAQAANERAEAARRAKEAEVAERVKSQKEQRLEKEKLRKVKTLGEAGKDVDDLGAWVARSRTAEAKLKDQERLKAAKLAEQLEEQDEIESDEEEVKNALELAGMRVRHNAEEINEGETMVLTLADRSILDDQGEIDEAAEELENALVSEDKQRRKALKAATKQNKPLFEEDGKRRGLLDKYDEEEQEAGMQIDAQGEIDEATRKRQRQDDIRARLKAAESASTKGTAAYNSKGDYYTKEEMEQFQKPKTKKKRKLRKKDTEEASLDIAALEAEASAQDTGKDRGSRAQKISRESQQAAAQEAEEKRRQERYENAMNKANLASLALRQAIAEDEDEEEADDDLQASLARARRAAQVKAEAVSTNDVAAEATRRREAREAREREMGGGLEFSEAKDFANSIQLVKAEEGEPQANGNRSTAMEVEEQLETAPMPPPSQGQPSGEGEAVKMETDLPPPPSIKQEEDGPAENLAREKNVGTGLAGAMALLRERGELQQKVEWAGRTNDMRKERLDSLTDIYSGGRHEDKIAADIEQALTERDEFGRVLTPKERFRRLCHNFHGKTISKTKQEKRLRKLQEEVDARRAATAEGTSNAFSRLGGQQMAGTPYMVLSGKLQPGQSSDPASGFATVDRQPATTPVPGGATPRLGGGTTPLIGDRKVEAMLGLKREGEPGKGAPKLPPPPPVNLRK